LITPGKIASNRNRRGPESKQKKERVDILFGNSRNGRWLSGAQVFFAAFAF
jgi:hypothetical protein